MMREEFQRAGTLEMIFGMKRAGVRAVTHWHALSADNDGTVSKAALEEVQSLAAFFYDDTKQLTVLPFVYVEPSPPHYYPPHYNALVMRPPKHEITHPVHPDTGVQIEYRRMICPQKKHGWLKLDFVDPKIITDLMDNFDFPVAFEATRERKVLRLFFNVVGSDKEQSRRRSFDDRNSFISYAAGFGYETKNRYPYGR